LKNKRRNVFLKEKGV